MAVIWLLGIVPASLVLVRSSPGEVGLEPDGAPTPPAPKPVVGATLAQATSSRFFRGLCATYALVFMAQVGGIAQLFKLATERVGSSTAEQALVALALSSVVGRLLGGLVVLKLDTRRMTFALILVQGIAMVVIALAQTHFALVAGAVIFGVAIGNILMLQPLLIAEAFGVRSYGRVYAFNSLFSTIGVAGGPLLLGVLRDTFDYQIAYLLAAALCVLSVAALAAGGPSSQAKMVWA